MPSSTPPREDFRQWPRSDWPSHRDQVSRLVDDLDLDLPYLPEGSSVLEDIAKVRDDFPGDPSDLQFGHGLIDFPRLEYLASNPPLQALKDHHIDLRELEVDQENDVCYGNGDNYAAHGAKRTSRSSLPRPTRASRSNWIKNGPESTNKPPNRVPVPESSPLDLHMNDLDPLLSILQGLPSESLSITAEDTSRLHPKTRLKRMERRMEVKRMEKSPSPGAAPQVGRVLLNVKQQAMQECLQIDAQDEAQQRELEIQQQVLELEQQEKRERAEAEVQAKITAALNAKILQEKKALAEKQQEERERAISERVQEYVRVRRANHLLCIINAWRGLVQRMRWKCARFQTQATWKSKQAAFHEWHKRTMAVRLERETRAREAALRRQEEIHRRAVQHHSRCKLSRAVAAWVAFTKVSLDGRELNKLREKRKENVQRFLRGMKERHASIPPSPSSQELSPSRPHSATSTARLATRSDQQSRQLPRNRSATPQQLRATPIAAPTAPVFLEYMREREERRKALRQERLQRQEEAEIRRKQETEERQRLEQNQAAAEAQRRREEQRQRQVAKDRAIAERQRKQALAKNYYDGALLRYRGLLPWRRFTMHCRSLIQRAAAARTMFLKRRAWSSWTWALQDIHIAREKHADTVFRTRILRNCFENWEMRINDLIYLDEIAQHHVIHARVKSTFQTWQRTFRKTYRARIAKEQADDERADIMAQRVVPRRYLTRWRHRAKSVKDERWHEYRRTLLRNKVRGWLQDSSLEKLCNQSRILTWRSQDTPAQLQFENDDSGAEDVPQPYID